MRNWMAVLCMLLAGCATTGQRTPPPDHLFNDDLFAAPTERIAVEDIFAVTDAMRRYVRTEISTQLRQFGVQQGLVHALYEQEQLKLQYDATSTRNAAQAFEARAGNCLSLVIMTAALAKELGLQVRYQSAYLEETWSRTGDLLVRSGHVNITLDRRLKDAGTTIGSNALTIDFLPAENLRGLRARDISEQVIVAMYMNNKAVEALTQGRQDDAYAWARDAIRQGPDFLGSYNTLGVLYMRRGDLARSERVFDYVLEREAFNGRAISNLSQVFARQGRDAESAALLRRLALVEPVAPFHYFNLGLVAMEQQNFSLARDMFAKEVARADYYAEFHFWLAVANYKLGEIEPARKHLTRAVESSVTRSDHDLYAAKLAALQKHRN